MSVYALRRYLRLISTSFAGALSLCHGCVCAAMLSSSPLYEFRGCVLTMLLGVYAQAIPYVTTRVCGPSLCSFFCCFFIYFSNKYCSRLSILSWFLAFLTPVMTFISFVIFVTLPRFIWLNERFLHVMDASVTSLGIGNRVGRQNGSSLSEISILTLR